MPPLQLLAGALVVLLLFLGGGWQGAAGSSGSGSGSGSRSSSSSSSSANLPEYCGREPPVEPRFPAPAAGTLPAGLRRVSAVVTMRHGDRTSSGVFADPARLGFGRASCWPEASSASVGGSSSSSSSSSSTPVPQPPWACRLVHDTAPGSRAGDISASGGAAQGVPPPAASFPSRLYRKVFDGGVESQPGACAAGQLTERGGAQQRANGRGLRKALVEGDGGRAPLLPAQLDLATGGGSFGGVQAERLLHLRADDSQRTIQSAEEMLLGLWDPSAEQTRGQGWLQLHTRDAKVDILYPNAQLCPKLDVYRAQAAASSGWNGYISTTVHPLLTEVAAAIGYTGGNLTLEQANALGDCTLAATCHGYPTPLSAQQLNRLTAARTYMNNYMAQYPSIKAVTRAGIGMFLDEWLQPIEEAARGGAGSSVARFSLFSGHDSTLMPMMQALNSTGFAMTWSPYATVLYCEVYAASTNPNPATSLVRCIYRDKPLLNLPGCPGKELCPVAKLSEALRKDYIAQDPLKECALSQQDEATLARLRTQKAVQRATLTTANAAALDRHDQEDIFIGW